MPTIINEPIEPIRPRVLIDGDVDTQTHTLEQACRDHGLIYKRDGVPVEIVKSDRERDRIMEMSAVDVMRRCQRHFELKQTKETKDGDIFEATVDMPRKLAQNFVSVARESRYLDVIKFVRRTPLYGEDWTLSTHPGYRPETRTWVDLGTSRIKTPTGRDVERAVSIIDDLMRDFLFDGPASKANAIGALLTHFIRPAIRMVPMLLVTAPTAGSGKTLLTEVIGLICHDKTPSTITIDEPQELEKRITASLMDSEPFLLLDNMETGKFSSGQLAALLTSQEWTGRVLGKSRMVTVPNDAQWMMTANNPDLSHELARRVVPVRLEPDTENPADRDLRDLHAHVEKRRDELIWACLEVIEHWRLQGMPKGDIVWGSYQQWAEAIMGILECAGWHGFADNRGDVVSYERDDLGVFVSAWDRSDDFPPNHRWRAKEIVDLAEGEDMLHEVIGKVTSSSWKSRRVTEWLRQHRGRVVMGRKIQSEVDTHIEQEVWWLERVQ